MSSEQEIRWKDLGTHFLKRWKSILVVTVLCTVALGGWQYLGVKKAHDAGNQTKEEARYAKELADYQEKLKNAQENVEASIALCENHKVYRRDSILMNLDPNNVWIGEKKYRVSGAEESMVPDLLAAYTGAMMSDHDAAAILEAFGTENTGYARELVRITADQTECSFTVTVWASDQKKAEKELTYVSGKIEETEKQAQAIGQHKLAELNKGVNTGIHESLISDQSALAEKIADNEDTIVRNKRALNNVMESEPFKPGNPVIRWAVTGGVLGLALMLAIYLTTFLRKRSGSLGTGARVG